MKRYNKNLGDFGENVAESFLKDLGYDIIKRNYRAKRGEIDIIARDGDTLVFAEVKTRSSFKYGYPSEAVDYNKRKHMYLAAKEYFSMHPTEMEIRFDVLEVYAKISDTSQKVYKINHIINVDV